MNRFVGIIIVVLFGLAAMSGPSAAAGMGSGAFWTIAKPELCLEPASIAEKAPVFKPCAKKINGHAVTCETVAAILPLLAAAIFDQHGVIYARADTLVVPFSRTDGRFRPPRVG